MMNTEFMSITFKDLTYPAANTIAQCGSVYAVSKLPFLGLPTSTDRKTSIVNSDRTDSRQDCLPQNAGITRKQVSHLFSSKTRGLNGACARSVSTANALEVDECARAHQHLCFKVFKPDFK